MPDGGNAARGRRAVVGTDPRSRAWSPRREPSAPRAEAPGPRDVRRRATSPRRRARPPARAPSRPGRAGGAAARSGAAPGAARGRRARCRRRACAFGRLPASVPADWPDASPARRCPCPLRFASRVPAAFRGARWRSARTRIEGSFKTKSPPVVLDGAPTDRWRVDRRKRRVSSRRPRGTSAALVPRETFSERRQSWTS